MYTYDLIRVITYDLQFIFDMLVISVPFLSGSFCWVLNKQIVARRLIETKYLRNFYPIMIPSFSSIDNCILMTLYIVNVFYVVDLLSPIRKGIAYWYLLKWNWIMLNISHIFSKLNNIKKKKLISHIFKNLNRLFKTILGFGRIFW